MLRRINCNTSRIGAVLISMMAPLFFIPPAGAKVVTHPSAQIKGTTIRCDDTPLESVDQARVVAACQATATRARRVSLNYSVVVPADACHEVAASVIRCRTIAFVGKSKREYRAVVRVTGDKVGNLSTKVTSWRKVKAKASASSGFLYIGSAWEACTFYGRPSMNATVQAYGWPLNQYGYSGYKGYNRTSNDHALVWGSYDTLPNGQTVRLDQWCWVTASGDYVKSNGVKGSYIDGSNVSVGISTPYLPFG